jgi:hypothetical protein
MMKNGLVAATAIVLAAALSASPLSAQGKKKEGAETRKPSAAMAAVNERKKKCGVEWKEAKAAGTVPKGQKWPQYWSACNKRLKGAGA